MKTRIIATIKHTENKKNIIKLIKSGVSMLRINFSFIETKDDYKKLKSLVKMVEKLKKKYMIAIAFDTKGPEIRIVSKGVNLKKGEKILITKKGQKIDRKIESKILEVNSKVKFEDFKGKISIDDNKIILKPLKISNQIIEAECLEDCKIEKNKSINIPNLIERQSLKKYLNKKDEKCLRFAVKNKVKIIFLSFINSPENLKEVKNFLGLKNFFLISKIESKIGLENIKDIEDNCDGFMIARGDLYMDLKYKSYSGYNRLMRYKTCKPKILATGVCPSLIKKKFPVQSEITEIGIAVTKVDNLMLSNETFETKNPFKLISTLGKLIENSEKEFFSNFPEINVNYFEKFCLCTEKICLKKNNKNFYKYKRICPERRRLINEKLKKSKIPNYLPFNIEFSEIKNIEDYKIRKEKNQIYKVEEFSDEILLYKNLFF